MTRAVMPRSHERFRCSAVNVLAISAAAGAEDSTATSSLAPRLNASMPSAPVPANRSNTRASSSPCHESRCENIASLVRSVVGRVPVFGVVNATPLNRPEIHRSCMVVRAIYQTAPIRDSACSHASYAMMLCGYPCSDTHGDPRNLTVCGSLFHLDIPSTTPSRYARQPPASGGCRA